jgi:hypothetical protein
MDQEFKKKWCEALRSGKYKQGRSYLRTKDEKFCCLGVALDVLGTDWDLKEPPSDSFDTACYASDGLVNILSIENLIKIFGTEFGDSRVFFIMNDDQKLPFSEIADYIEANYK